MNCKQIQRLLSDSLDSPLPPSEAEQVRVHMASCPACARYSRTLHAGTGGLRALPPVPASPRVRENVLAYVAAGRYGTARPRNAREWFGQGAKIAGAMTVFVLVALVLMSVFNGSGTPDGPGRAAGGAASPTATSTGAVSGEIEPTPEATPMPLPACVPGQVELSADVALVTGYANAPAFVSITITALKSTGGIICQLTAPLNVAVLDTDGLPVDAIGNPGRWHFDTPLPGEQAVISFAWTNWCGATDGVSVSANTDTGDLSADVSVALENIITPPCSMAEAPATLGALVPLDTAESLPACDLQQDATFNHYWEERDGVTWLWVGGTSMTACTPGDDVTITLIEANRAPLEVDGNPLSTREAASIGGVYYAGFTWSNWCGDSVAAALDIARPSMGAGGQMPLPACENPDEPSRLEVVTPTLLPLSDPNVSPPPAVDPPDAELPACDPAGIALATPDIALVNDGEAVSFSVALIGPDAACSLSTTLIVTLTDANGTPLDGTSEGLVVHMDGDIARLVEDFRFVWENWCGDDGEYTVNFALGEHGSQASSALRPSCLDPQQPTTLTVEQHD